MNKKNTFWQKIKLEFKGWKVFELLLMLSSTIVITTLGILAKDTVVTIIAGVTGVIAVILGAKGKIGAFVIATINSVLYILIAIKGGLLSSLILHSAFYIPMNFVGFIMWFKKRNDQGDVQARMLSIQGIITFLVILVICWISYAFIIMNTTKATNVWLDSYVLMATIVAIILMTFRYVEQWALWLSTSSVNLVLWLVILINIKNTAYNQSTAIIFIIMFGTSLINSIYGFVNWLRLNRKSEKYNPNKLASDEIKKLPTIKKISYKFDNYFTKKPKVTNK